MKAKAIGYTRVSTEDQANEGISMEAQEAKILAYCSLKEFDLIEVIADAGISAKNLNRPGAQRLVEMAQQKKMDAVVVYRLDRMFRSTVDALETTRKFDRAGISFHSIEESLDTKSAMGNFFFTLTAALAELERRLIGERTRAALQHKKAKGERTGHIPFGFTVGEDGKQLIELAHEQAALEKIRALHEKGLSLREIADELNERGILNRTGRWNHMSIKRVGKF